MKITEAISVLQKAMTARYGSEFRTETGAGTITIAHDRVELTDPNNTVCADGAGVVQELEKE